MMEVAPGIWRIEAPLGDRIVCMFLLAGDRAALLVDTGIDGSPQATLAPALAAAGLAPDELRYVLITHSDVDHVGGNGFVRELAPRAQFLCHEADRVEIEDVELMISRRYGEFAAEHGLDESAASKAWLRASARTTPIDLTLSGGEWLRLSADWRVQALHTPGHSRGHLTVYDPRSQTAIIADAVLGAAVPSRDGSSAVPPTYRYVDDYLATIAALQGLPIATLLCSHFPVMTGPAVALFLSETRAYVEEVEASLCAALRASQGASLGELVEGLGGRLGSWPAAVSYYTVYPLLGHLERLCAQGRVTRRPPAAGEPARFSLV